MIYYSNKFQNLVVRIFPIFLILVGLALPAMAGWAQKQKITSTPRGVGAQFGNAVAINGNTMVVGARFDSTTANQAGAAYVYILSGGVWVQQAVLLASDGALGDKFGYSVAISENTIVVGAFEDDITDPHPPNALLSNAGSAYVFVRNGTNWAFQQKLTDSFPKANQEYGNAVAITGETIAVGDSQYDAVNPQISETGAVYIYRRTGMVWAETQKLLPAGGSIIFDYFGESVAMSAGKLVVGSPGADIPFTGAGSVYVFVDGVGGFTQQDKISIASGANGDQFGCAVAIEGNTMVGGALQYTPIVGQPAYGAAYVFEFNGTSWISQGRIVASDGATVDRFGYSVAVSNSVIAVGAREDDTTAGLDAGSTYIFTRSGATWTQQQRLAPNDPATGDRFGSSVAMSFGNLVVGAAEKQLTAPNGQGAVYYLTFQQLRVRFDFDGDAKADIAIFRALNGEWWIQRSLDTGVRALRFGSTNDRPVPADYDGDGLTDNAVYRPSTGEWFVLRSSDFSFFSIPFGNSFDKPAPGDFDGDGLADIAVFRPFEGNWYINKTTGGVQITQWGGPGDVPVTGDYDGDGRSDIAIYRPISGQWWLNRSTAGVIATTFGAAVDKPVAADYTGDGKTDIAVWRPSNGNWFILRSDDFSYYSIPLGSTNDLPAPADYDGDGKADIAVFRPDGANWFIQRSTAGILLQQFGATGDIPVPSAFVP